MPGEQTDVESLLDDEIRARFLSVDDFDEIDSTNSYLFRVEPPPPGRARLALAQHQTAGRGRHDRPWYSEPGASLCLSLAYSFARLTPKLPLLTLMHGVAVSRALHACGIGGVLLKWPNDIVYDDQKLGGLLAESHTRGKGPVCVVAGVGINLRLPAKVREMSGSSWAQRAVDIASIASAPPPRALLSAQIAGELLRAMQAFEREDRQEMLDDWRQLDWLLGRRITVDQGWTTIHGIASGVSDDGELLVETEDGLTAVVAGSILLDAPAAS